MTEPIQRGIAVIRDAATTGAPGPAVELSFPSERTTVRAVIRQRVLHAAPRHPGPDCTAPPAAPAAPSPGPGGPAAAGDAEQRVAAACRAFERNGLLVLVGERQATELDEEIDLAAGAEITFLALVPLAGG
ncbi:hypothetical protein [Nocardiopsis coralliicola]